MKLKTVSTLKRAEYQYDDELVKVDSDSNIAAEAEYKKALLEWNRGNPEDGGNQVLR